MTLTRLSEEQLASYHQNGFVIIPDVFTQQDCVQINQEIDDIIAQKQGTRDRAVLDRSWILGLGLKTAMTERLAKDQRFLNLVEDMVYPGIAIYSAKLVPKAPHNQEICHWHQDDSYYIQNSQSDVRMSVWLALHDSFEENGAVHFVPGSHKWGQQDRHELDDNKCTIAIKNPDPEILKTAVCPKVKKGSVVLFHAHTWHYSGPNQTDQARRSFIVSYQDALASSGNGAQWKILRPAETQHHTN